MTLRTTAPHAKPRWLLLGLVVVALTGLAASSVLGHGATSIPANFFTVADQGGVNDVNSDQVDLTQFGRDDTNATKYKLFWSWDSHDSWTGTGQTGDACALFDNDGDGKINFAVCARVANLNANTEDVRLVQQDATHPVFAFNCSDAKNDRCAQPTGPLTYSSPTDIDAGVLSTLAKANLITETDPFPTGEDSPHDTTIEVDILKAFVPGTEVLVNVCSYPSAGNGGNNNPFDCIVNPGGGFLSIVKDAGVGVTSPTFGFSVNTSPATTRSINGSGTASPVSLGITTTASVTETTIPSPWALQNTTSCKLADGSTVTGTLDLANSRVTGITIQSGLVTTCTFVDRIPTGTLVVIKHVINDNGGTATASQFRYTLGDGSSATNEPGAEGPGTSYTRQIGTTYNVTENSGGPSGYSVSYSGACSGSIASGTQTCTITNDDQAATLTVIKHVINDNGGTRAAADWTLDSGGANDAPDNFAGSESGTAVTLDAGSYNVTESGPSGYTASFSANCSGTIANGESKTCIVTNDDQAATLTVIKHVINDNGGTNVAADWTLDSGGTNDSPDNFAGSETGTAVTLDAGSYNVTESGPSGYNASFGAGCSGTIANGQTKTCTVTNDDNAATLIVIKHVINDNGGTNVAADWTLDSGGTDDSPDNFAGSEDGTTVSLSAGSYNVTESGPTGYAASFSANCSGTIANGQTKTCTVTNNDPKASPGITTTMKWTLNDSVTLTGFRTGGTGGTATFSLYKDDPECDGTAVFTEADVSVSNVDGTAATTTGYTTTESGTYRWVVAYSGNNFNDPVTSTCGSETTTLP